MRLRNSILGFLARTSKDSDRVLEGIRQAMLDALDEHCDRVHSRVVKAINAAQDIPTLWYVRPDLMQAISSCRDESVAHTVMHRITAMFRGHYGSANNSRFGAL